MKADIQGQLAQPTTDKANAQNDKSPDNVQQEKLAHFAARWGSGKPDKGESRERFEYDAGQAAIKDIRQYGELSRTREGDLYFTSTELPWKLVPLIHDDQRLIAFIDQIFRVR